MRPTLFAFLLCHFALRLVPTWLIEGCHVFWNAITTVPSRKTLCMSGMPFLRDSLPGLASRASRNLCCTLGPVFRRIWLPLNAPCYHTDILCNGIFELVLYIHVKSDWMMVQACDLGWCMCPSLPVCPHTAWQCLISAHRMCKGLARLKENVRYRGSKGSLSTLWSPLMRGTSVTKDKWTREKEEKFKPVCLVYIWTISREMSKSQRYSCNSGLNITYFPSVVFSVSV